MGSNAPTEDEVTNENVEDEEEVITFDDLVNINESLERDAELLLGGQNDSICTYPEGYKYRQPLYACLTCTTENAGQLAGVCYACSCNCHDGHDLVEMFTKRKFCCDCGNSKFKSKCKLYEEKCEENVLNKYNDNFKRIYCVCKRTYPPLAVDEAEAEDAGEMHQCCICEDWFHLSHIFEGPALTEVVEQLQSQRDTEFDDGELLCRDCVARLPFLLHYTMKEKKEAEKKQQEEKSDGTTSATRSDGENVEPFTMRPAPSVDCKLEMMKAKHVDRHLTPESRYVGSTWRLALCRCTKCMNMYDVENCAFLVDPEDTMTHYDAERQRNMQLNGEPELAARTDGGRLADGVPTSSGSKHLGSDIENLMYDIVVKKTNNHDAALDAYLRVKQMYAHLGEFFTKCADKDKTITRRDVERCFEELQAKRPRLSTPSEDGAWTQGRVKKTQKVRNVLHKMIHKTDSRIKEEYRVIRPKKKDEHAIKTKEAPRISSAMFLKYNTQLGPPFHVIVDTNFVNLSISNKIDMMKGFMDCLYAKVTPYIPDCVLGELEKMGSRFRLALKIVKDKRFKRLTCTHKGIYADDCIVQRVTQHKCYIVATCDRDLRMRLRRVPGVPIMYIHNHRYTIERMPDAYGAPKLG